MALPTLAKTWVFSVNNRISYVSLNDTMARYLYGIKNFLVATMGWTVVYTCDGTTGPSSATDHTDRWTSFSAAATRGAASTNAQSFAVLQDGNGVQMMLAYQGASDDVARFSFSQGALFTPAATANNQPTATDEAVFANTSTIVATTSSDRVWFIMATNDRKLVRFGMFRSGSPASIMGLELVNSTTTGYTWSPAVVAWSTLNADPVNNSAAGRAYGATTGTTGAIPTWFARINSTNVALGGGGEAYCGSFSGNVFAAGAPELNAAPPIVPLVFSSTTTNFQGKAGNRIDIWCTFVNGISQGDVFGALQFAFLGTFLFPWDGASTVITN